MPRSYRNMKMYKKEILELRAKGLTQREIGEKLGFSKDQVKGFIKRHNANQRKLATGIALKKKGRPAKACVVTETDKVSELKYILARKEAKIRQLEMENELMRDFLSLAENFFSILKTECIYRVKLKTYEEARLLIDQYIHFYNYERIQLKTKLTPLEQRCQFIA